MRVVNEHLHSPQQIAPSGAVAVTVTSDSGSWTDAMNFVNDQYQVPNGVSRPGYTQKSNIDVAGAGKVTGNGTYELRWLLAKADSNSLEFRDAYFSLELEHTV